MESADIRKLISESADKAIESSRERKNKKRPIDKTCLSYWYPKISPVVPTPKTIIVEANPYSILIHQEYHELKHSNQLDKLGTKNTLSSGKAESEHACMEWDRLVAKVMESALTISECGPWFLRTGQTSGKHEFDRTCYVTDIEQVENHMGALIMFSQCADMFGLEVSKFVVREYLPVKAAFKCKRYGNMPVVRELRVFIDTDRVVYHVPYWPTEALEEGEPDILYWQSKLRSVQYFSEDELAAVLDLASRCGYACPGRWSVDILDTERGWMVTDMAEAEKSYGYDASKYAAHIDDPAPI